MKKYILLLFFVAMPCQAFASGCDCGSINGMLMNNRMQTVQEINAHTSAEAKAIRSEILTAAQSIIGTLKAESATIVRAIVALKESNVATAKGEAVAREAMKTEDLYGKAAQPAGLCGTSSLGAGIQLGAQAGKEVHATMREKQLEYANSPEAKPVEFLQRVLAEDHPTEKEAVETFFPLEGTLTEDEVARAHETVKTLGNPRPLPVTTDGQKETPAGQTYEAARKIHESRIAVIAENLNAHVVHHAPTLPDDVAAWGAKPVVRSRRKRQSPWNCGWKNVGSGIVPASFANENGQSELVHPDSLRDRFRVAAGACDDAGCPT